MMYLLGLLAYPIYAYVVWVLFLAIMRLKMVKDAGALPQATYRIALPLLGIGYLADFILNLLSSFLFVEPPKEFLLSARVSRHINEDGYRGKLSRLICHNLLDPFDPTGCHCK